MNSIEEVNAVCRRYEILRRAFLKYCKSGRKIPPMTRAGKRYSQAILAYDRQLDREIERLDITMRQAEAEASKHYTISDETRHHQH